PLGRRENADGERGFRSIDLQSPRQRCYWRERSFPTSSLFFPPRILVGWAGPVKGKTKQISKFFCVQHLGGRWDEGTIFAAHDRGPRAGPPHAGESSRRSSTRSVLDLRVRVDRLAQAVQRDGTGLPV